MNFYQGLAVVLLRVLAAKIIFDASPRAFTC